MTNGECYFDEYGRCFLCPWDCGVNRLRGERGRCGASAALKIDDYMAHFGEEGCLVGSGGSGAVFISHCTLRCIFCQTYELSWKGEGNLIGAHRFFEIVEELVGDGCENINFISPTQYASHIKWVVEKMRSKGIDIPVVYNTNSFEKEEIIDSLKGIVDVYLADMKFWSKDVAGKLCGAEAYPEVARAAIKMMYDQVGDLVLSEEGIARRGLIIRHLVLPGLLDESFKILEWITSEVSTETYVNIMGHYRPCHRASTIPGLNRTLKAEEYRLVWTFAEEIGLKRLDTTHHKLYPLIWSK